MKQLATYKRKSQAKPYSSGFTLLEILVSIVVLSFGLLGMVGIQAMALKSNNDAKQQSAAVQLAAEYSDMMRGNKAVAIGTDAASNPYLIADYVDDDKDIANPTEFCSEATCSTTTKVAEWEKYDWLTRIRTSFPGARVKVCYDTEPYTAAGIPQWDCKGAAVTGNPISIKIGWPRASTNSDRSTKDTKEGAITTVTGDKASPPSVIYAVTPGSST